MRLVNVDPRSLKDNPNKARQTKSSPQADALMLATIKAVGVMIPPIVYRETTKSELDTATSQMARPRASGIGIL